MKIQITYLIIVICFLLSSIGNDPYPNNVKNRIEERNEVIQTLINDI